MKTKLSLLLGISALALLLTATPVFAAEVDVTGLNEETGFNSDNDNDWDVDNDVDVDVDNDGDVDNDADVDADTGNNEQNQNTKGGDLESGEVDVTGGWENVVNKGWGLCGCPFGDEDGLTVDAMFENNMTGAESDNDNDLDVDNDLDIDIDNMADIMNDLDFDADTGNNQQNQNTKGGSTETGDATLDFFIANWANNSSGDGGDKDSEVVVDVTASNMNTGFNSDNDNDVDVDNDVDIDVDNDADIDNDVDVDINTGNNQQNQNTKGGNLTTGDGDVVLTIENHANNSECCPKGGKLTVKADLENNMTGALSDNDNDVDVDNDVDIDVDNDADIDNDVDVDVDTGNNQQNQNTTGGSTKTGDVSIDLGIFNKVNSSI